MGYSILKYKTNIAMRKMLLSLQFMALMLLTGVTSCAQHPADVNFAIATDPSFEGNFYPSLAMWNSHHEDPSDLFLSFYLVVPHDRAVVRIKIEESKINEETIIQRTLNISDGNLGEDEPVGAVMIDPIIKWKYEELAKLAQGGAVTLTCILEIDGKEIDRINHVMKYRPVNECIYAIYDQEEGWVDTSEQFALFVNEDYPAIDKILAEILAVDPSRQFIDTQGSYQDMVNQLYWVWEYFAQKGTRYSNVVQTSNESETLGLQYVRFIDQALGNNQANCVDGSALLCSIYRKLGFDVSLIMLPGHCKFTVQIPYQVDFDGDGIVDLDQGFFFVESTLMGSGNNYLSSFQQAFEVYSYEGFNELMSNGEVEMMINIGEARSNGIMPIIRTQRGGNM